MLEELPRNRTHDLARVVAVEPQGLERLEEALPKALGYLAWSARE